MYQPGGNLNATSHVGAWRVRTKPELRIEPMNLGHCWIEQEIPVPGIQLRHRTQQVYLNPLPEIVTLRVAGWLRIVVHTTSIEDIKDLIVEAEIRGKWREVAHYQAARDEAASTVLCAVILIVSAAPVLGLDSNSESLFLCHLA